uniref:Uncharacterized protein n=1 Tax=Meloidogyne javanica TaxID=6303 RepID=A0A915LKD5_MELJA
MSSPFNKRGGHIHAIVLAIGAGKVDDEMIKELFIDKTSKSLTSFFSQCSDNSLFCHLFNNARKQSLNGMHKLLLISDDDIYYEDYGTEFVITLVNNKDERKLQNDTKWIEKQNASILYNLSLFKTYEYLEELLKNKNEKERNILNQTFIVLKNWAKAHCVYNSQFGFLDGTSISLMLTKYKHFIVFSCITEEEAGQENFCGFLENLDKINEKIEKINQIEIYHIGLKTEDCPTEIQKIKNEDGQQFDFEEKEESENLYFCTSWLVGIKGKDEFMDKDLLKFEIEEGVKATGVTEDLKIFVILQEEIENWGFEVNQDVELM